MLNGHEIRTVVSLHVQHDNISVLNEHEILVRFGPSKDHFSNTCFMAPRDRMVVGFPTTCAISAYHH